MNPEALPLRDIHLPPPLPAWPPAPGWWIVAVVSILALLGAVWLWHRQRRRLARYRAAQRALRAIVQNHTWNDAQKLSALSMWLRRVALSYYPRERVASLTGAAWREFLQQPLQKQPFDDDLWRHLTEAPYQLSIATPPFSELQRLCESWLRAVQREIAE